ncbi:winged helix-turn-helix domain-containing protein [Tumebacillus flagellatus]|uniref:ATPase dynein-related AAA domain-containing protein n=1 Tax=Tumebacillus flagellatus TaxID=1157490 RepID=A0A074LRE9_9BACL|nr:winged helix-turn-helix domain-containing protein [Tumebacillus flagellatus]KEO84701.1 hypothetical protein EL26_04065 [Tumebacillus flagellatus]
MGNPKYKRNDLPLPFLKVLEDETTHSITEVYDAIAGEYKLTKDERYEKNQSGKSKLETDVLWVRTELAQKGLLDGDGKGTLWITSLGKKVLSNSPELLRMNKLVEVKQLVLRIMDEDVKSLVENIQSFIRSQGYSFPKHTIGNFYLSLKTKPFVILAGISGTGKTKLVKLFAEALGATKANGQFNLIPVRPDWNDPSDLIGYTDLSGKFQPGTITKVLYEAIKPSNSYKPYFICLDEMNLARVEHYFSDLLSIIETQEWKDEGKSRITTHTVVSEMSMSQEDRETYGELHIPENVYFIGTVNMDETTHPFSKKVLDRANTIEFNYINLEDLNFLDDTLQSPHPIEVDHSFLRSDYLTLKDVEDHTTLIQEVSSRLQQINKYLEPIQSHIGYRVRDAVCFYMTYNDRFKILSDTVAFDMQLCQKILPRVQGSSTNVKQTLIDLLLFAAKKSIDLGDLDNPSSKLNKFIFKPAKMSEDEWSNHFRYVASAKKIAFMLRRFDEDGFTSFWLS